MPLTTPTLLHAIDTTGPGGAETVFLQLAEHLRLPGLNNLAIIKGPGWVEDQLKARGLDYLIVKPSGFLSIPYYAKLVSIIHQRKVKLIQANLLGSALTYAIVSLVTRTPLVATLHGRVDINPQERFVAIKNLIMRMGINQLVAVSQDLANYIQARKLFNRSKISVIYNGIATEAYGKSTQQTLRASLSLKTDDLLIGSVGNVRPAKDYANLVNAAQQVVAKFPNAHFVIAGHQKPDLMAQLDQQIASLQLSANVHFVGFQNSAEFLSQVDFFALSSSTEGFSIATIEAMATGLPVVATACGGPQEILEDNTTGRLVPIANPAALAQALIEFIENPSLASSLATAGTAHAKDSFSADIMLQRYGHLYKQLAQTGSATAHS